MKPSDTMKKWAWVLALVAMGALAGCESDEQHGGDTDIEADAGHDAVGGGEDVSGDDVEEPDATEPPAETALVAAFEAGERPLGRAVYGLTAPQTPGEPSEVYLEAYEGGFEGCPQDDSPTPERAVLVNGLEVTAEGVVQIGEGGLSAVFFDYAGDLAGDAPFLRSTEASGQVFQAAPGAVALTLDAQFEGGRISGTIVAEHCPNLDL